MEFGWNCDTSSLSFERIVQAMRDSKATTHLIMIDNTTPFLKIGDIENIKRYLNALPNITLIVRVYSKLEGDYKAYPSAAEYQKNWAWVKAQLGALSSRVILDDPTNEPNLAPAGSNDAALYVERCVALVKAASLAGIKLAVGAFSVGSLQESIISTTYRPLWLALKEYKQAISYHSYGAIPFEAGETAPLNIVLDAKKARAYMKDERWPMSHGGWLLAEPYRIIQACEALGFTPEIYLTECLVDNVLGQDPVTKEAWRAKYGIDAFMRDPRGVQCWERYLTEFFSAEGLDFQHSLYALFRHARKNIFYHPAFKGACIFALNAQWGYGYDGKSDGTHKHAGSNFDRPEFELFRKTLLGMINTEVYVTPTPVPVPTPSPIFPTFSLFPAQVRSLTGSNIRSAPNGTVIGQVPQMWADCLLSKASTYYDSYNWYTIEIVLDGNVKKGWVADTLAFEFNHTVTPPPPPKQFVVRWNGSVQITVSESDLDKIIENAELEIAKAELELEALRAAKLDNLPF